MHTNEEMTNKEYEAATSRDVSPDVEQLIALAREDKSSISKGH